VRKTLRDWRRAALGWGIGLAAVTLIYVGSWASLHNDPNLLKLKADAMPAGISAALGVTDLSNGAGYLQGTVYSLVGPLLLVMAAIVLGARAVAGPEDRHTMDLLLANPISRRRFVAQRTAALVAVVTALGAVAWLVPLVLSQALDMHVGAADVTAASLGLLLVGLLFGALALAVGAATGRRSTALAVAGAVAVAGYVLRGLADSVSWLHGWRWATPFHYYLGTDPLHHGFAPGHLLVLAAATALLVLAAVAAFDRRDLRA
jgi:ABC-2 type transport system permease protein